MSTYKKICITNRHLVDGDFLKQIELVCESRPDMIILREKDMQEAFYELLTLHVMRITKAYDIPLVLHSFTPVAKKAGIRRIHLTMDDFIHLSDEDRAYFEMIGVSTHSIEEALLAEKMGADYITASHIFATDCKKGLEPRGLHFLKEVCQAVAIPVYALGGIHEAQIESCIKAGAAGVCQMSEYMYMRNEGEKR